ncbi:MAG: hypothetical protein IT293_03830 [Deltaproteobacteria bacterium]|nr:hypothetical protein [Deltaproteobacteria bacterium]
MRKTVVVATLAAFGGFCLAAASSFAALRYNIWKGYGEQFQLGYVVGYLDAVSLAQRKDSRLNVPTGGGKNFDRWVADINTFYADPANQNRSVPDAMFVIGSRIRDQMLQEWGLKRQGRPVPTRSAAPE